MNATQEGEIDFFLDAQVIMEDILVLVHLKYL